MKLRKLRTAAVLAVIFFIVFLLPYCWPGRFNSNCFLPSFAELSRTGVPAVIHQMAASTEHIPAAYTDHVTSWLAINPGHAYRLWTDPALRRLIRSRYPEAVNWTSSSLQSRLEFSDVSRYFLLLEFGGIYADMDVRARRPLFEYLSDLSERQGADGACGCFLGREPQAHAVLLYGLTSLPSNALMACQPGHEFMRYVLHRLPLYLAWQDFGRAVAEKSGGVDGSSEELRRRRGFHASRLTGPLMLHRLLRLYQSRPPCSWQSANCRVCLMEPEYTMPYADPSQLNRMRELCDTVARQPVRVPLTRRALVAKFCSERSEEILLTAAADRAAGSDGRVVAEHDFLHLAYTAADSSDGHGNGGDVETGSNSSPDRWLNLSRLMAQFPGRIELRT